MNRIKKSCFRIKLFEDSIFHMRALFVLFVVIYTFHVGCVSAQTTVNLYGTISDMESGEILIGSNIVDSNTNKGSTTNNYGFFNLNCNKGENLEIVISHIGYVPKNIILHLSKDTLVNIQLTKVSYGIDEVVIWRKSGAQSAVHPELLEMSINDMRSIPSMGAEVDVLKAYQLMPGVAGGSEGSANIYVRGGDFGQNLILLDDTPLYSVNHLGGFVSVFNSDAIKKTSIIKGGFPARYGNRLSSIVDIRMRDGNENKLHGDCSLGLISSKLTLDGPVNKGKSTFLFSARRLMWDLFMYPLSGLANNGDLLTGYTFYDVNAKYKHRFSDKSALYFSFYKGDDKISNTFRDDEEIKFVEKQKWGNLLSAIRFNYIFNSKLFSNTTISFTSFRFDSSSELNDLKESITQNNNVFSGIKDLSCKIDFEYHLRPDVKFMFGANTIYHRFMPGSMSFFGEGEVDGNEGFQFNSVESNCYVESQIQPVKHFFINLGLRYNLYGIGNNYTKTPELRVSGRVFLNRNIFFNVGFTQMNQNVHLLTYPNFSLPNADIWIPSTTDITQESSNQGSLGVTYTNLGNRYKFSLQGYYKTMSNLIELDQNVGFNHYASWMKYIIKNGNGKNYGIEFYASKSEGRFTGWISYTYSRAFRQFDKINYGSKYPFKYDRPHSASLVAIYDISERLSFSSNFIIRSGSLMTISDGRIAAPDFNYEGSEKNIAVLNTYSKRNNVRMNPYHRLDLSCTYTVTKKNTKRIWRFSIYNLYNHKNPFYYYWDDKMVDGRPIKQLYQKSIFPIIPSVSYSLSF